MSRKRHIVGKPWTTTLCGLPTYRRSVISVNDSSVSRAKCCDACVLAEMKRAPDPDPTPTRRDDAALAVARLREHCADYGYGFDATESRGPTIAATMSGGTVVEIVITVRVEEPDGAVRE